MAACGMKLQNMFEKALPDNSILVESLSWNHCINITHACQSSFLRSSGSYAFRRYHNHCHQHLVCLAQMQIKRNLKNKINKSSEDTRNLIPFSTKIYAGNHEVNNSFSSMSSESLQLCTEGLGFESFDTANDFEIQDYWQKGMTRAAVKHSGLVSPPCGEIRRPRVRRGPFPPPISCIGGTGKPRVYFKSCKQDGRFVLKEIMIPTLECLHASREDGRLKLHFVHKDDDCDYPTAYENDQENRDKGDC